MEYIVMCWRRYDLSQFYENELNGAYGLFASEDAARDYGNTWYEASKDHWYEIIPLSTP